MIPARGRTERGLKQELLNSFYRQTNPKSNFLLDPRRTFSYYMKSKEPNRGHGSSLGISDEKIDETLKRVNHPPEEGNTEYQQAWKSYMYGYLKNRPYPFEYEEGLEGFEN